jgi:hypothetical protein
MQVFRIGMIQRTVQKHMAATKGMTSPFSGDAPDGPPEDKNEAKENSIAGDAPDGPVDIREEGIVDRESETSSAQAHEPTNAMLNNFEATAAGHPPENEKEHEPPPTPLVQDILSRSLPSLVQTPKMNPNRPPILKGQV